MATKCKTIRMSTSAISKKTVNNVGALFYKTLKEEKQTDETITQIADKNINVEAAAEVE